MRIAEVEPEGGFKLRIKSEDGKIGLFDVSPYMKLEVFQGLHDPEAFKKVTNGGYFVEWDCGADLSADTIEEHLMSVS